MDAHDGYCQKLAKPEPFNFALSLYGYVTPWAIAVSVSIRAKQEI